MAGDLTIERVYQHSKDTRGNLDTLKSDIDKDLEGIWKKLSEIQENLNRRLPLWATMFIGFLCSIVGALIVLVV